jgi:hypothetical protein
MKWIGSMADTVRDLIKGALLEIGARANGEEPTAAEAEDALELFNEMLEQWNLESLMIHTIEENAFPTVAGKRTYTLGTGGDWNIPRPEMITNAMFREVTTDLRLPMKILTDFEFQELRLPGTPSTWPRWMYNDNDNPLSTIYLWPVPSLVNEVILYSWKPIAGGTTLDTTLAYPSGYKMALRYNLAEHLSGSFGATDSTLLRVSAKALETKANIKRRNSRIHLMRVDRGLLPTGPNSRRWDWRTGEYL